MDDPLTQESFAEWVAAHDALLEDWLHDLEPMFAVKLDRSPESLRVLGRWLLDNVSSGDASSLSPAEKKSVSRAAIYTGEVFREAFQGQWDIELEKPRYMFYRRPVVHLTGFQVPMYPLGVVLTTLHRGDPEHSHTILTNKS